MKPEDYAKFNEMYEFMQQLKSSSTIPLEVDSAFRDRFADIAGLESSAKSASSESETVNEAGASTYNVLSQPDGFLLVRVAGVTRYIPYYG